MQGRIKLLIFTFLFLLVSRVAFGTLTIEITRGVDSGLPIAIVPFGWTGQSSLPPENMATIVSNDLEQSGRFKPMPVTNMPQFPAAESQVNYAAWRGIGIESLVVGQIQQQGSRYRVLFQLVDIFKGPTNALKVLAGREYFIEAKDFRKLAHQISDIIFEKLTGIRGAFSTKIAYVSVEQLGIQKKRYRLEISDIDGYNAQEILVSSEPLMSPAWSPRGDRLAYVSFERKRPEIYIQSIATGQRQAVASFPGLNGAPAWSPDGQSLALVLSKDGNPEIYLLNLMSRQLTRFTHNAAIDTEPQWSPDGRSIIFTSDRGGKPQVYRRSLEGGREDRLTFTGDYNARPRFTPDGLSIIMVHRRDNRFHIAVQDVDREVTQVLTETELDESPTVAPNGSMVVYATQYFGKGVLSAVSMDGRVKWRVPEKRGEVREPAWSPFFN